MSDKYEIDIQAFAKAPQSGKNLNGKDGLLTPLSKQITEAALGAELDALSSNTKKLSVNTDRNRTNLS